MKRHLEFPSYERLESIIMKNAILAIALASAGWFAVPASAQTADTSGFFINGNIGQSNLSKTDYDDDDAGYAANLGYRWTVAPNALIGIEGGYTRLGSFAPRYGFGFLGEADIKGWNLGINGHFNLTSNWYISARGGLFRTDLRGSYINSTGSATPGGPPVYGVTHIADTSNQWYAGAGFGYDFNSHLSVGLNYDYYKADKNGLDISPDMVSVSAEYRF